MLKTRTLAEVLDHDFLELRGKLLEVAATLDRLDRSPTHPVPDLRLAQITQALEALLIPGPGRAETVQRIFSREYDSGWRQPDQSQAR